MKVFGKSRILQDLFHLGKLKETWSSRITSQHGCSYFVGLLQVASMLSSSNKNWGHLLGR